ncbi:diaminobutyrate-2-oxoglutarate transaminase [Methylomagnum ishizawai]|uniref:Diaminobutyrate-2-oxoglutarate transaminase n=1 Tax=Methylomagnum ishizawai TaxID=1760988 RepID=A0A1Y6D4K1_9GAMM|nr:diaminobutyrate--2-oxoglutarate transaminase [Methylomagnum ishizawai]SMF97577.1 diaminobutyrate-2-oxoglutarate transaminase [Methylomagnum ishizawai]
MKQSLVQPSLDYTVNETPWAAPSDNAYYLDRQAKFESNARSYPRRLPIAIRRAEGIYVEDTDGRRYIDCLAGAGALALGHRHPVALAAVRDILADGTPWQTLDLTTPVKDRFVEELFATLPQEFTDHARIQFCGPSGADAVEAALKLVKTATGRRSILAFHGAYHGMTHGALGLTGELGPKLALSGLMADVHFLPFPQAYRCPFGLGGSGGWQASATYIEYLLDDSNSGIAPPAAVILEPVQGEGGVIPAPDPWLREIRRLTRERGIPLILDEVQTGIGRTGRMYAFEHADILPDVLVLSKAIGGGLPLSAVVYHEVLDRWQPGAHAGTFRGNQLAMATGVATLRYVQEQRLDRHAADMGQRLQGHLRHIQADFPILGDVRGRGLMIGVEVVDITAPDRTGAPPPCRELARRIQTECLRLGLILELGGRQGGVVRFLPPLIVTAVEVDQIAEIFRDAVQATAHHAG